MPDITWYHGNTIITKSDRIKISSQVSPHRGREGRGRRMYPHCIGEEKMENGKREIFGVYFALGRRGTMMHYLL